MPRQLIKVMVRGQVFDSVKECADHFGVTTEHVYICLCRGKTDTIGLRRGYKPEGNPRYSGGRAKPVTLGGVRFPSIAAAGRALGWAHKRLEKVLRDNGPVQRQLLYKAVLDYERKLPRKGDSNEEYANDI